MQSDPDVQAFVERLEQTASEEESDDAPASLPSGETIARDLQRFLRQRGRRPRLELSTHSASARPGSRARQRSAAGQTRR